MRTRPAVKVTLPVIAGILLGRYSEWTTLLSGAVLTVLVILLIIIYMRQRSSGLLLFDLGLMAALVCVGLVRYDQCTRDRPSHAIEHFADLHQPLTLFGTVAKSPEPKGDRLRFKTRIDSIRCDRFTFPVYGHTLVSLKRPMILPRFGDYVSVRGELRRPTGQRNPGEFDYQGFLASQDITTLITVYEDSIRILSPHHGPLFLTRLVYPIRDFIITTIERHLPPEPAALLKGLLVGARSEIPYELITAFGNTGVIHVLAVSGLHVGFVLLILTAVIGLFHLPRWAQAMLIVLGLIFYVFLTEAKAPVLRATIMAIVLLLAAFFQRRTDVYNSLCLAALVILLIDPRALFDAGFQLSFVSVLSITFFYHRIRLLMQKSTRRFLERGNKSARYFYDLFFISLAAQLGTLPLVAYYFNKIPIVALLANLVVVPGVGLIVALGFISVLTGVIYAPLGLIYANAAWLLLSFLIAAVRWGAGLPFAYVHIATPSVLAMVIYYAFLGVLFFWDNPRARKFCLGLVLIGLNLWIWSHNFSDSRELKVTFFDVGNGDATLVEFPNGKTLLIDAGERSEYWDVGERTIAPYLYRNGYRKIDALVLTHPHNDHYGGVFHLMANFKIGRIIKSGYDSRDELYRQLLKSVDSLQIPVQTVMAGDTVAGFEGRIFVLSPTAALNIALAEDGSEINNSSLVLKMVYGASQFLLMADAEREAEASLLRLDSLLVADVIKIGHHGSQTSSTPELIARVQPNFAVVSVGRYNRYGFPSARRLRELRHRNIIICRTDSSGAIVFKSDGQSVRRFEWRH